MSERKNLVFLAILLYSILALHLLALHFHWYWLFWWYDILMHFLGGLWLGGTALWFLIYNKKWALNNIHLYFWSIFFVLLIGVGWEIFEFSLDTFIIFQTNDIIDTASDLGMDCVGGLSAMLYARHIFK